MGNNVRPESMARITTKELADAVHAAGKKINVWTVDKPESAIPLAEEMNVEYITSNILE